MQFCCGCIPPNQEEVSDRVERAVKHAQHVLSVRGQFPNIEQLIFLVPQEHDCGATADALRERLEREGVQNVEVLSTSGHHSCETLNEGVARAHEKGATHAVIISGKAVTAYLTSEIMEHVHASFTSERSDIKVAGVATDELRDIVRLGRIQNTFAVWDIEALLSVGGFDARNGVEEIAPLVRLRSAYGPCFAIFDRPGGKLHIANSEVARARHADVMATKIVRQREECERLTVDFLLIESGIASLRTV